MTAYTIARSLSRPVKQLSLKGEFTAQVLGMFENACDLVTPAGDVVALVVPQIGNGPFNIVVDDLIGPFAGIKVGTPASLVNDIYGFS